LLFAAVAFALGIGSGYVVRKNIAGKHIGEAEEKASKLVTDAKTEAQEAILSAKTKATETLEKAGEEVKVQKQEAKEASERIAKREESMDKRFDEVEKARKAPESVVISAFDPVRREIAKIALEKLIEDGRIHPAKIEEVVVWAEKEIDNRIREAGEAAAYEVGIAGLDPKLLYILGRLRYRTSFKQNVLLHSLEVAYLAGAIAAEVGADVKTARMAGLFHDIGKAVDHEVQGTHVEIGIKILEKFGIDEKVVLGMRSHHDEYPYAIPEAYIVTAADALSSSRPGARKDTVENYIKRLEELEMVVNSFGAVEKSYAIQAGREVRVFVNPEKPAP